MFVEERPRVLDMANFTCLLTIKYGRQMGRISECGVQVTQVSIAEQQTTQDLVAKNKFSVFSHDSVY